MANKSSLCQKLEMRSLVQGILPKWSRMSLGNCTFLRKKLNISSPGSITIGEKPWMKKVDKLWSFQRCLCDNKNEDVKLKREILEFRLVKTVDWCFLFVESWCNISSVSLFLIKIDRQGLWITCMSCDHLKPTQPVRSHLKDCKSRILWICKSSTTVSLVFGRWF